MARLPCFAFGLQPLLQPLAFAENGVASGKQKMRKSVCLFVRRAKSQKATLSSHFFAWSARGQRP
jgi:hypothetical protein